MENTAEYTFSLEESTICVLTVNERRFEQALPAHSHGENAFEFHYVVEGKGIVVMGENSHEVKSDFFYVTGPGVIHEQIPEKDGFLTEFGVYVQIPYKRYEADGVLATLLKNSCWLGPATGELKAIVAALKQELKEKKLGFQEKIQHMLAEFLIACARNFEYGRPQFRGRLGSGQSERGGRVYSQLMLDEIFLYEYRDITLDSLARRMGFSVRQTQRWIRKVYGKSFQEKKLEARMSAAAMMLVSSQRKITDISELLGYSSIEHFSSAFAKYYGVSPRKYRKQMCS